MWRIMPDRGVHHNHVRRRGGKAGACTRKRVRSTERPRTEIVAGNWMFCRSCGVLRVPRTNLHASQPEQPPHCPDVRCAAAQLAHT